jgi:hypothetical protein
VAEREASGDFDYLLGTPSGGDARVDESGGQRGDEVWTDESAGGGDGSFNAFDTNTWYFEPEPAPWYRTKSALTALIATAAAASALVVSGVLLVFGSSSTTGEEPASVTPAAPTTVASSVSAAPSSSPEPPPPPPPPPPPEEAAAPVAPPAQTYQPRAPRTTKEPEIGVTRTPVTRSPLSVSPPRPGNRGAS